MVSNQNCQLLNLIVIRKKWPDGTNSQQSILKFLIYQFKQYLDTLGWRNLLVLATSKKSNNPSWPNLLLARPCCSATLSSQVASRNARTAVTTRSCMLLIKTISSLTALTVSPASGRPRSLSSSGMVCSSGKMRRQMPKPLSILIANGSLRR